MWVARGQHGVHKEALYGSVLNPVTPKAAPGQAGRQAGGGGCLPRGWQPGWPAPFRVWAVQSVCVCSHQALVLGRVRGAGVAGKVREAGHEQPHPPAPLLPGTNQLLRDCPLPPPFPGHGQEVGGVGEKHLSTLEPTGAGQLTWVTGRSVCSANFPSPFSGRGRGRDTRGPSESHTIKTWVPGQGGRRWFPWVGGGNDFHANEMQTL